MARDYSNQENINYTKIPVKGAGADKFSIHVDRIRFTDDDSRHEIDIRVWSNSGRPSGKGLRLTLAQAEAIATTLRVLVNEIGEELYGDKEE